MSTEKSVSDIGKRFLFVREQIAKKKQSDFGALIGIAQNTLSDIENGKRRPKVSVVKNLAYQFAIRERWLLTGEGEIFDVAQRPSPPNSVHIISENAAPFVPSPKTETIKETCCIPPDKRQLIEAVIEVLDSGTMHAKALEQNIMAFHHAVQVEKRQADSDTKIDALNKRVELLEAERRNDRDQDPRPPAGSSGEEAI